MAKKKPVAKAKPQPRARPEGKATPKPKAKARAKSIPKLKATAKATPKTQSPPKPKPKARTAIASTVKVHGHNFKDPCKELHYHKPDRTTGTIDGEQFANGHQVTITGKTGHAAGLFWDGQLTTRMSTSGTIETWYADVKVRNPHAADDRGSGTDTISVTVTNPTAPNDTDSMVGQATVIP